MDTGVARQKIDLEEYKEMLERRVSKGRIFMNKIFSKAKQDPKKVVFPEGESSRILRAAHSVQRDGIATPIVLGDPDKIRKVAEEYEIDVDDLEIINPSKSDKLDKYADAYYQKRCRRGINMVSARGKMHSPVYFGMMMLEMGDCDALVSGVLSDYTTTIHPALEIIPLNPGISRVSGLYAMISKNELYMLADTTVNIDPTADELAEIAFCAANVTRAFDIVPRVAMLSFSNFGSARYPESTKVTKATEIIKKRDPELIVEGEMQADTALMPDLIKQYFPFSRLQDKANVFIFPDLNSGNIAYKLLERMGGLTAIGPILLGFSKAVHVLQRSADVNQIVDMVSVAVVDAQLDEKNKR